MGTRLDRSGFRGGRGQGNREQAVRFDFRLACLSRRNVRSMVADLRKCVGAKEVKWRGFDEWVCTVKSSELPYAEIPVNREVKYDVPRPAVPLEKLELLPNLIGGDSR